MGYSTSFKGELRFTSEPTVSQLVTLKAMCGENCREHPEWNTTNLGYIDLELTDDFSGLRWNEADKTYDLELIVNVVLGEMRKKWPDFGLTGTLTAQGEDLEDRWELTIGEDGLAHKLPLPPTGKIVKCPSRAKRFEIEA